MTKLLKRKSYDIPTLIANGTPAETTEQKAEALAAQYESVHRADQNFNNEQNDIKRQVEEFINQNREQINSQHYLSRIVTSPTEIAEIIKKFPNNKAPGLDEIENKHLTAFGYKMIHYKIPKSLILLIHSYLTNRELLVQLKNTQSTKKLIGAGVPQGSVLGPTLFNIFINDIPIFAKTNTALYADDTAIYASSFSAQIASKQIQIHINLLEKFYDKWKIKINAEKTQQIIFTRKFTDHKIWDKLRVYDNKITDEPHVKYLGTYIDTRLNFFKNTKYLISKASAALKNMYSLMNRNSKLTPQNKVLMYKTIFRPILTYAAPVWCHLSDTAFKPLEVFQNKCLRLALNESRYARIVDLQERSATTSLRAFVNKLSNNFYSHQLKFNKLTRRITKFRSYNTPFRLKHKLSYQHLSIYDK
ncbi:RNA-directed DNA polymerase from mobile element jockey-like Protein [Tribolium castaneum]|uniref:RNA-directed DNA polymerase from mobile element jockey-like Protein n=1 Tax=Tribolium castaneum TaxID=7070 RepID=D6WFI4_TRICA|nr:RNA-directed DNA polymerase from mobile element jockey-like Protein [Tribolium castaneum]